MQKITPEMINKLRKALIEDWDPIGVALIPGAHDEYDAYIQELCKLLLNDPSEKEIFDYLWMLETEYMGLEGDKLNAKKFAKKIKTFFR
jgi:hypothetical protein